MPNRLASETSPYLLQHADNPVDWYPWGDDALQKARTEDKPILVSIGYSACYWCHVMERESFEDDEIARTMNREFVNIKVDREERPDLDAVFQDVVQLLIKNGGWPLTVFLTPNGRPYYGGTYYPPEDRPGISGFRRVLLESAEAYHRRRNEVDLVAQQVAAALARLQAPIEPVEEPTDELLHHAYHALTGPFDAHYGGFGLPPKFPQPMVLEFLLRYWLRSGVTRALEMVEFTLQKMAAGGIRDQIGGGFHRYSTDNRWLVPHFEKMLYDNAILSLVYLHAYQATHKPSYREMVEETLDYVLREMTAPSGGFYTSQDADTEGVEGKFYTWTPEEMTAALGVKRAGIARKYFGVTERGRLEGRNVLHLASEAAVLAKDGNVSLSEMQALLKDIRQDLFNEREQRIKPGRDEKILTNWNGLMMRSFAEAGITLGRRDYVEAAARCARFLYDNLSDGDGVLHTWKDNQAKVAGFLEDYSMLIEGLLSLHEATLERRWLDWVQVLGRVAVDRFWDSAGNQFVDVRLDQPVFLMRPRNVYDGATPSGSSAAAFACLRLASITKEAGYEAVAMSGLRSQASVMGERPLGSSYWLSALDFHLGPVQQIAIVGPPSDPRTEELVGVVFEQYRPNHVLVGSDPTEVALAGTVALLRDKNMTDGLPTAFVCEGFRCGKPVNSTAALRSQLQVNAATAPRTERTENHNSPDLG